MCGDDVATASWLREPPVTSLDAAAERGTPGGNLSYISLKFLWLVFRLPSLDLSRPVSRSSIAGWPIAPSGRTLAQSACRVQDCVVADQAARVHYGACDDNHATPEPYAGRHDSTRMDDRHGDRALPFPVARNAACADDYLQRRLRYDRSHTLTARRSVQRPGILLLGCPKDVRRRPGSRQIHRPRRPAARRRRLLHVPRLPPPPPSSLVRALTATIEDVEIK